MLGVGCWKLEVEKTLNLEPETLNLKLSIQRKQTMSAYVFSNLMLLCGYFRK